MRGICGLLGVLACATVACWSVTTPAFALSAERHYEMVSPVFKGGFGANAIEAVAQDGEAVAYQSPGSFAGAPSSLAILGYIARRGASGWSTVPIMPPAPILPYIVASDMSPALDLVLKLGKPGPDVENPLNEVDLMLHPTDGSDAIDWELDGVLNPLNDVSLDPLYRGASLGFCHVLLSTNGNEPIVPEGLGVNGSLYDFDRGCNGEPASVSLVGMNNKGTLINRDCQTSLGNAEYFHGADDYFNAVSDNGAEVFFTVCLTGTETNPGSPHQLFVRLGGSKTLEVSRPLGVCVAGGVVGEVPCEGAIDRPSADFAGASEDGSTVYFTTSAQLTPGDLDSSNNLYMAKIGCPAGNPECGVSEREVTSLTRVSQDPVSGQAADVQGVVRVAPDGTRAYFVAGGDLLSQAQQEALAGEGRPLPQLGAENLYVYDSTAGGAIAFVGDLCSGRELSGTAADIYCPSATGSDEHLWTNDDSEAQTAGTDGKFLVFATYAQLLPTDSNVAEDVYRYDSETGRLDRISGGEGGYDANGNRTVLNENGEVLGASIAPGHYGGSLLEQYELDNRAISEDGSRIVFASAEPLSSAAANGQENVYEWHESPGGETGSVSLISSGGFVGPVYEHLAISPNGLSIFFVTQEGLVPQDTDGAPDIYDARLEEGFPQQAAERRPCEGDACQGALTNPAPLLVPGSVSQAPGENLSPPPVVVRAKGKPKPLVCGKGFVKNKRKCVRHRPKKRSSGRGSKR